MQSYTKNTSLLPDWDKNSTFVFEIFLMEKHNKLKSNAI
jgi:hypothetical protein